MKPQKTIGATMLQAMREFATNMFDVTFDAYIRAQVRFDRRVLKRYFGIETPLYRMWHKMNVESVQKALDRERDMERFEREKGCYPVF